MAVLGTPGSRAASPQAGSEAPKAHGSSEQGRSGGQNRGSNQPRRGFWWKNPEVMKEVGIGPELSKKLDELFHQRLPGAIAQEKELKKQQDELSRLLRERTVGTDVIAVQVDRVEAQRTTLNKSRYIMVYRMYQLLSAEQYAKLVAYNERQRNGRGNPFR
jgi:Spy/CpxP family protein refolding chaperone